MPLAVDVVQTARPVSQGMLRSVMDHRRQCQTGLQLTVARLPIRQQSWTTGRWVLTVHPFQGGHRGVQEELTVVLVVIHQQRRLPWAEKPRKPETVPVAAASPCGTQAAPVEVVLRVEEPPSAVERTGPMGHLPAPLEDHQE